MHRIALGGAIAMIVTAIYEHFYLGIFIGILHGYIWSWFSHFFIERNSPATFKHPFMSLYYDFKMLFTSDEEIEKILNEI